jgi:hypothetical protein
MNKDKKLFWRIQGQPTLETHASWDCYTAVDEVVEPANDGWPGYWWATVRELGGEERWVLIRESDVEAARAGEAVDTFVAGLYGCDDYNGLYAYIRQIGGVDEGDPLWVALYEGEPLGIGADDGEVFKPIRLIRVWPAHRWYTLLGRARS